MKIIIKIIILSYFLIAFAGCEEDTGHSICGGILNTSCPSGYTCISPNGTELQGVCVKDGADAPLCIGFAGLQCPSGYDCVNPNEDVCDDCFGVCVKD